MKDKNKVVQGSAKWAKVFTPETRFNPEGDYTIDLIKDEAESTKFIEYLEGLVQEKMKEVEEESPRLKGKLLTHLPFDNEYDQNDQPTGNLVFKFKKKASGTTKAGEKYTTKIIVVDSKRTPMDETTLIGNGSTVKVAFEPRPYFVPATKTVGVTLRLHGVQVLELMEYTAGGGATSMFEEEEGFVLSSETSEDIPFDVTPETVTADDDDGDF